MRLIHKFSAIPVIFSSLYLALPAEAANLVQNGSFEQPLGPGGQGPFNVYTAPNFGVGIPRWNLTSGSIDVFTDFASDGNQGIDTTGISTTIGGPGPGTLEQSFQTVAGDSYQVSFDLSGGGEPVLKEIEVSILDESTPIFSEVFTFDASSVPFVTFIEQNFSFVATSPSSTIRFRSLVNQTSNGPYIDNIIVVSKPVPEPLTVLGTLAAAGFGVLLKRKNT